MLYWIYHFSSFFEIGVLDAFVPLSYLNIREIFITEEYPPGAWSNCIGKRALEIFYGTFDINLSFCCHQSQIGNLPLASVVRKVNHYVELISFRLGPKTCIRLEENGFTFSKMAQHVTGLNHQNFDIIWTFLFLVFFTSSVLYYVIQCIFNFCVDFSPIQLRFEVCINCGSNVPPIFFLEFRTSETVGNYLHIRKIRRIRRIYII